MLCTTTPPQQHTVSDYPYNCFTQEGAEEFYVASSVHKNIPLIAIGTQQFFRKGLNIVG